MNPNIIDTAIRYALEKIANATVLTDPFPHIFIDSFFPEDFYQALIDHFPERNAFRKVRYPGAGYGKRRGIKKYYEYGFACNNLSQHYLYSDVSQLFSSADFSKALLDKFSQPLSDNSVPIPLDKHQYFQNGESNYTSVFDLQIDLPGYELPPHPDTPLKIITYQLFLTEDDSLRDYGTYFCRPKGGKLTTHRPGWLTTIGTQIDDFAQQHQLDKGRLYRKLELSTLGHWLGIKNPEWLPWGLFDVAKIASALPNHFMAFAPSEYSYHGVRMDIPEQATQERCVFRGFIRAESDQSNWIYDYGRKRGKAKQ